MLDATRSQQCLARLCQLITPQLLLEVWPVVLRIARHVYRFRSQAPSPFATQKGMVQKITFSGNRLRTGGAASDERVC